MDKINKVIPVALLIAVSLGISVYCTNSFSSATSTNVNFSAELGSSATIEIPSSSYSLSVTPSGSGSYDSVIVPVTVYSNNATGYLLTVSATNTSLVGTNNPSNTIETLSDNNNGAGYALNNFAPNRWGIALNQGTSNSNTRFYPATTIANPLEVVNATLPTGQGGMNVNVSLGANVNLETIADSYTTSINFSVVAKIDNALRCVEGVEICYMQDISEWGGSINTGESIQVVDRRDDKAYWATKDSAGNFWMTQNLDFDIDSNTVYTSNDTDLPQDSTWSPSVSTNTTNAWVDSSTSPQSYDPGEICWNGELKSSGSETLSDVVVSCNDASANQHYSIGNYYNWTAAIAVNDSSNYAPWQSIDQSICPAGWKLPIYDGDTSYVGLTDAYDLTSGLSGDVQESPFYFTYSGEWSGGDTASELNNWIQSIGVFGTYWSNRVYNGNLAFKFIFKTNGDLVPNIAGSRYYGFPVRCVSR